MKLFSRAFVIWLLLGCTQAMWSQTAGQKIDRVDIKFVGPAAVSEEFVRVNIRVKAGDIYNPTATQNDVHSLYSTGQFYEIQVSKENADDGGAVVTYHVQVRPRVAEIKLEGNKKLSDSKLKKLITVKVGEPFDEQKLFTDKQEMIKLYEKYGYADTQIKYVPDIDEPAGTATVTFQIVESPKVKITQIEFVGAAAFTQKQLRGVIKLKQHWMWSWLTGNGVFKQDEYDDDKDLLTDYYRSHGYLDFRIDNVKMENPTKNTLVIRYYIYEGRQYKVGAITITGNKAFSAAEIRTGMQANHDYQQLKSKLGPNGFAMDVGDIFTPEGRRTDIVALQDFYGSKGYIDYLDEQKSPPMIRVNRIPNVDTGTMDLEFQIDEGQKTYVEKINITGNVKTKDKVIRRELAISPGEVFDMVRVKVSQQRLDGLNYFEKVNADPAPTDPPISGHKNLDIGVEEKNTGNLTFGAGFSSVDSLVGYVEMTQGNFDLFHPPNFTGGGEKLRLKVQLGTERQDYELSFIEPWFMNRKLVLSVDLYRHQLNFESPHNMFDETRTGMRLGLTKALPPAAFLAKLLGDGDLSAGVSYTIDLVGITLNSPYHDDKVLHQPPPVIPPGPVLTPANVPHDILEQTGDHLYNRLGMTLAYDTRNSTQLPNHGQRSEIDPEISVGNTDYYKLQFRTSWFFPGLHKGHVIEVVGRTGIAQSFSGGGVPFEDRYYLGGIDTLRGFQYRNVSPRQPGFDGVTEPIGGDSMWFGSVEYSIPLLEEDNGMGIRFAGFFDIGSVGAGPTTFSGNFDDNWGLGFRLNIPHLGPLRLDYGIPITHDKYNGAGGQFQFSAGYTRPF